ncbi:hypothetical protein [Pseudomonas citronellolis]|uniref:hypothetical protein n=1 Tax=Pseudomonas citronellolis TaxID=53408 RepID=UPI0023E3D6FE|nr:hypothetical protein [Pseudomonas citronellolis]MDF3933095.1 hypothetical protein [Pseudomonas citronellolis]
MLRLFAVLLVLAGLLGLIVLGSLEYLEGLNSLLGGLAFVGLCEALLYLLTLDSRPRGARWQWRGTASGQLLADK